MTIVSVIVDIVGGMGGPNDNAIPVYADNKAPNGEQLIGPNGKQLMLENSSVSGVQYIVVNPTLLTPEENAHNAFVTFKADGKPNYCRFWILNPETGKGEDYAGETMWGEYSHFKTTTEEPPESDVSTLDIDWTNRTVTLKPK